jgi:UDP-glucose 4-epimerase
VSSSGAAYGYHADNPPWLQESDALRGNEAFAYSHHKRLADRAAHRHHPRRARRQPDHRVVREAPPAGRAGQRQPVHWDEDVAGAILHALHTRAAGCFNLAGDGALTLPEIASGLGKPLLALPASVLRAALAVGKLLRLTRYGPEQLDFLRYRPVLLNTALKERFGYVPAKTSAEAFEAFVRARAAQGRPVRAGPAASGLR